jgi:tetratricopeptide (TPR) repeat protein
LLGGCSLPGKFSAWTTTAKPDVRVPAPAVGAGGDWKTQQGALEQQLRDQPDDPVTLTQLAFVLASQGKHHAAEQMYRRSLALAPNAPETHLYFAQLLARTGERDSALWHARRAAKLDPTLGEAHALSGQLLRQAGRNREAMEALQKAWSAERPAVTAALELAEWDLARGNAAAASDRLRLCLAYEPDHTAARRQYANLLTRQGKLAEAAEHWQQLIDRGDPGADNYFKLARLQLELGRVDDAARSFREGKRIAPTHPDVATLASRLAQPPPHAPHVASDYPPLVSKRP